MAFVDDTDGGRVVKEGMGPMKITLADTVRPGDMIGYKSGWVRCDTDATSGDTATYYPEFIAGQAGVSTDVITAYREALVDFGSGSTATVNDELFVSSTLGGYTVSSGSRGQLVGFMSSGREAWIAPKYHFFPTHYSRTYDNTSGDATGLELRTQRDASSTAEVKCIEASARVGDTYAVKDIAAVKGAINVKGTTGNVTGRVVAFHAELESGSGGTRTFSLPVACYYGQNKMGTGTYTKKVVFMHADAATAGKAWDGFLSVAATGTAGVITGTGMGLDPCTDEEGGYIKVYVDTTEYQMPFWASS